MMNVKDINKLLETAKWNSRYDDFPLTQEEQAIEYLLFENERLREASWAAEKYISGTAILFSHRTKEVVLQRLQNVLERYKVEI